MWLTQGKQGDSSSFLPSLRSLYDDQQILQSVPVIALGREAITNIRTRLTSPFYMQIAPASPAPSTTPPLIISHRVPCRANTLSLATWAAVTMAGPVCITGLTMVFMFRL